MSKEQHAAYNCPGCDRRVTFMEPHLAICSAAKAKGIKPTSIKKGENKF